MTLGPNDSAVHDTYLSRWPMAEHVPYPSIQCIYYLKSLKILQFTLLPLVQLAARSRNQQLRLKDLPPTSPLNILL